MKRGLYAMRTTHAINYKPVALTLLKPINLRPLICRAPDIEIPAHLDLIADLANFISKLAKLLLY